MRNIFKKLLLSLVLVGLVSVVVACKTDFKVTFDSGSDIQEVIVKKGELVAIPTDPTKAGQNFMGWYTSADASESTFFDFSSPISGNLTLHAGWTTDNVVRFITKTQKTIAPKIVVGNGTITSAPASPSKVGFTFEGWYTSKVGKTWNEKTPVAFPLSVSGSVNLFAYYEPISSKEANWSAGETYKNSFVDLTADPVLNPLVYRWSHESDLMSYMQTVLYGTDVNWDQAIADGLADFPGDFSKLDATNIGAILRENILVGGAGFPEARDGDFVGEDGTDQDGKFSEVISRSISARTFRYTLRDDVFWENGDQVTADDYLFSYLQYINATQNNYRGNTMYPTADRTSGMRVLNARGYRLQGTEIGFGETDDGKLVGDYGKYILTRYLGPETTRYPEYIGVWPFGSPAGTIYLTEAEFDELGLEVGRNQPHPLGLDLPESAVAAYDLHVDIVENPWYVGNKGEMWPVVSVEDLGFKVIDHFTFEITYETPTTHAAAMSNANAISLVHPATYTASLNSEGTNSTYGTSVTKPLSYGAFVLKTWDTSQKIVFNKNYNSITHVNYNYKSISFEFYADINQRMEAFAAGLLDVAGLNQQYYGQYVENPNMKSSHTGYAQYFVFNAVEHEGQNSEVAKIIKLEEFRKAFMFGFNRIEYARTIYAPNVPTLSIYPINGTQYDNDEQWYTQTPEYREMIEDLGFDIETFGYDPVKAKALFDQAYAVWLANGNTGPIPIKYLAIEGAEDERIDNYVISSLETLFGTDKLDLIRDPYAADVASDKQDAWEFDMTMTAVGTGEVTNTSVMLPILGLFYKEAYDGGFGFNSLSDLGIDPSVLDISEDEKLDFRATWEYLKASIKSPTNLGGWDEETDSGTIKAFFDILNVNGGYFVGNLNVLNELGMECTFIWAGLAPQYDGDVEDRNTVTRAFDRIILEHAVLVPLVSRTSAVVYSSAVVSLWPAYHNIMLWGQARYWFLNTDPDFQ